MRRLALAPLLLFAPLAAAVAGGEGVARARRGAQVTFDVRSLSSYLSRSKAARTARAALVGDRSADVVAVLSKHLRRRRVAHRNQLSFVLAWALLDQKDYAGAEARFARLEKSYPLLVDYHRLYRARALAGLGKHADAARVAALITDGSVLHAQAIVARAKAMRELSHHSEVAALWLEYLKRWPGGAYRGRASFRIGEAFEALGPSKGMDALQAYKRVLVRAPLSRFAARAEQRLRLLARRVKGGAAAARLTDKEQWLRAHALYWNMRNRRSELAYAKLLQSRTLDARRRCTAAFRRANSVFKARKRWRAAPLFARAAALCRKAKDQATQVRALYKEARGYAAKGRYSEAAKKYLALEKAFPKHSFADDARLYAALAYQDAKKLPLFRSVLRVLPKKHPSGDMAREALWRLAREAYLGKRYAEALRYLDTTLQKLGPPRYYFEEGRALYWKARILDRLRKRKQARALYAKAAREYPLSYYALQSFNRLRERHAGTYGKLWRQLVARTGRKAGRWRFSVDRQLVASPYFKRGIELLRLGFGNIAASELARAGLRTRGVSAKRMWFAAVLFDRAGDWARSHQVPRSRDRRYQRDYPLGENYRRWKVSFPRAFAPYVEREANANRLPPELVRAIMREESGFRPSVESYANAVGLMQLILPTARRAARRFKLRVDRRALHDPATNIKLGAYFLGWLYKRFGRTSPLAIAGYNAGGGAVNKWLRRFRGLALDELVERIPYRQTRRYTKRVLASLFAYAVLHNRRPQLPRLALKVPRVGRMGAFGAKKKRGRRTAARAR
ncbi:MAG: transglycosylase SLT domain-containing protein [Myxococcales bacterium]|nr:transglycosylase SLT domain-containing protein [Myxococcales bacterium]